jgi:hypothetical protein
MRLLGAFLRIKTTANRTTNTTITTLYASYQSILSNSYFKLRWLDTGIC